MKKFLVVFSVFFLVSACIMPGKKAQKPVVNQASADVQQQRAADAFDELDRETGGKSDIEKELDRDVVPESAKPKPSITKDPLPKPTLAPSKPTIGKPTLKRNVKKLSSLKPETKYPMQNGFPVWFTDPYYDGYFGAVGIAKKVTGKGYAYQKRMAKMLAQNNLAKNISVLVDTEVNIEQTQIDRGTVSEYRSKLSTLSKHDAEQYLKDYQIQDEWTDENTGELYVWLVLKK